VHLGLCWAVPAGQRCQRYFLRLRQRCQRLDFFPLYSADFTYKPLTDKNYDQRHGTDNGLGGAGGDMPAAGAGNGRVQHERRRVRGMRAALGLLVGHVSDRGEQRFGESDADLSESRDGTDPADGGAAGV